MKFETFHKINSFKPSQKEKESIFFEMVGENRKGSMHFIEVFDGISITFNDFEAQDFDEQRFTHSPLLSINYCYEGRIECDSKKGKRIFLNPHEILVTLLDETFEDFHIPSNFFKGITLSVDLNNLGRSTMAALVTHQIDLQKVVENIASTKFCVMDCGSTPIRHLFQDLMDSPLKYDFSYLKIKILEALYIISSLPLEKYSIISDYIENKNYETMKQVAHYIVSHYDSSLTLNDLCKVFQCKESSLKKNFKLTYGMSITAYIQKCRVYQASRLLATTDDAILTIAEKVGYKNPSKFSEIFKREKGMTPLNYRKQLKH